MYYFDEVVMKMTRIYKGIKDVFYVGWEDGSVGKMAQRIRALA